MKTSCPCVTENVNKTPCNIMRPSLFEAFHLKSLSSTGMSNASVITGDQAENREGGREGECDCSFM